MLSEEPLYVCRVYSRMVVGGHQQPDVNYIQVLEKVDFPCTVNAQHLLFKGNQLKAETGSIVHIWLLVGDTPRSGLQRHF